VNITFLTCFTFTTPKNLLHCQHIKQIFQRAYFMTVSIDPNACRDVVMIAVIRDGKFLIGRKTSKTDGETFQQTFQGGIEQSIVLSPQQLRYAVNTQRKTEYPSETAVRELLEEGGFLPQTIDVIYSSADPLCYEIDPKIAARKVEEWGGLKTHQRVFWVVAATNLSDPEITAAFEQAKEQEFESFQWMSLQEMVECVSARKTSVYQHLQNIIENNPWIMRVAVDAQLKRTTEFISAQQSTIATR
jgi:8-oxo-dGTP pyrophosphatase MutT (NUDIX family)